MTTRTYRVLLSAGGLLAVLACAGILLTVVMNRLVHAEIEAAGHAATAAPVTVDRVRLSLLTGRGEVTGLLVGNPDGFDTDRAFALGRIGLRLDVGSLTSDMLVIRELTIDGAELFAEQQRLTRNNLVAILRNVRAFAAASAEDPAWSGQLVVEQFRFTNGHITVRGPFFSRKSVRVPDVVLNDLGTAEAGVAVPEGLRRLLEPVLSTALSAAGTGVSVAE